MTGIQYMLLSMIVALPAAVFIYYFSKPSDCAERDKLYKEGIKSIMSNDIRGEL